MEPNAWQPQLAPLAERYELIADRVTIAGRTFEFLRPPSADAIISDDDFNRDERLPYWAEIWPSSLILAERLLSVAGVSDPGLAIAAPLAGHPASARPATGRRLLELGSGVGLTSLAAVVAGFAVTATDYYDDALALLRVNALRQGLAPPATRLVDWRAWPEDLGRFDVVVGADILYERAYPALVAEAIARSLAPAGVAFITDPQRQVAARFPAECEQRGLTVETAPPVAAIHGTVRQTIDTFTIRHVSR